MGLRAVDKIVERHGLDGVYGPLYRLFEVADPNFNLAVELTAGNRQVFSWKLYCANAAFQFVSRRCGH
jgi:hypothetical protein